MTFYSCNCIFGSGHVTQLHGCTPWEGGWDAGPASQTVGHLWRTPGPKSWPKKSTTREFNELTRVEKYKNILFIKRIWWCWKFDQTSYYHKYLNKNFKLAKYEVISSCQSSYNAWGQCYKTNTAVIYCHFRLNYHRSIYNIEFTLEWQ